MARAVQAVTNLWDREFPDMPPPDFLLVLEVIKEMLITEAAKAVTDVQVNELGLRRERV